MVKVSIKIIGGLANIEIEQEGIGVETIDIVNAQIHSERVGEIEFYTVKGDEPKEEKDATL